MRVETALAVAVIHTAIPLDLDSQEHTSTVGLHPITSPAGTTSKYERQHMADSLIFGLQRSTSLVDFMDSRATMPLAR